MPHRSSALPSLVLLLACAACASEPESSPGPGYVGGAAGTAGVTAIAGAGGAASGVGMTPTLPMMPTLPTQPSAGSSAAGASAGGSGGAASLAGSGGSAGSSMLAGSGGSAGEDTAGTGGMEMAGEGGAPGPLAGSGSMVIDEGGTVEETIVVHAGETFDGENKRYRAGSGLGDGSQSESQDPVFLLEDGAHLVNVVLGAPAADGIHCYGDVMLENIVWEDVGEDAMTIKESGTVVLDGGSADLAEDKIFQINAPSTFRVSNFTARNAGKLIRQNGGTTFEVDVFIDSCDIAHMDEAIFRTDSSVSTVSMTNTRYSDIGEELFMGVTPANITQSNNQQY